MVKFRDTEKKFVLQGYLLQTMTNRNYKVDHVNLSIKKTMYDFAKEMHFDEKALSNKIPRDRCLSKLPNSPAIMVSGISTTFFII